MLKVGCSGWAYDDWAPAFYPQDVRPGDRLDYYGRFFPTAEINSTFYRFPNKAMVMGWVEKGTRISRNRKEAGLDGFLLSLKVPQLVTHEHLVKGNILDAAKVATDFEREVAGPLKAVGLLGSVLFQLSPYFRATSKDGADNAGALDEVLGRLDTDGIMYTVEFRHGSWIEPRVGIIDAARDVLKARKVACCLTDGPGLPELKEDVAPHGYFRFHGRNRDIWFKGGKDREKGKDRGKDKGGKDGREEKAGAAEFDDDDGDETGHEDPRMNRYDYLYSEKELGRHTRRFKDWGEREGTSFVYFNNHPSGKGPKNALQIMDMLDIKHEPKDVLITSQKTLF